MRQSSFVWRSSCYCISFTSSSLSLSSSLWCVSVSRRVSLCARPSLPLRTSKRYFRQQPALQAGKNFWSVDMDDTTTITPTTVIPSLPTEPLWTVCPKCQGQGKLLKSPTRKARLRQKRARQEFDQNMEQDDSSARTSNGNDKNDNNSNDIPTTAPILGRWEPCALCDSKGILPRPTIDDQSAVTLCNSTNSLIFERPRIAVIGGGLAGLALATAARHRGLNCTVYERDEHFHQRRQGYGLTMQQASKALCRFGIVQLRGGITSTKHMVHQQDGKVVGEWGLRKWGRPQEKKEPKRQNIHIARQALRYQLWQTAGNHQIQWSHHFQNYVETPEGIIKLQFKVGEKLVDTEADILIGADGIRSQVRHQLIGEDKTPLRYLDCIVILGICPLEGLPESHLLDGETVFQTADGTTRIYMMPYSPSEYMWQLSFPMREAEASELSRTGSAALREAAIQRCHTWHSPVAEILKATPVDLVSGYPVYDRALLEASDLKRSERVTLIGDACHPMSPFKGQGANQALLDALSLVNEIYKSCISKGEIAHSVALATFEAEMLQRSAVKVQASAEAAKFLHTHVAIQEGNVTRGAANQGSKCL